jgi:hypothetical protein
MPAKYVRPYSKGQKNHFRDAEAISEAVQRPTRSGSRWDSWTLRSGPGATIPLVGEHVCLVKL